MSFNDAASISDIYKKDSYFFKENNWEYIFINNINSINFKVYERNNFPSYKYEDNITLKQLHESYKLLTLYDNIYDIILFLKESFEKDQVEKLKERNYFKFIFKSPLIDVSDIIIKIKPVEISKREKLIECTKEIVVIKKLYNKLNSDINSLQKYLEKNESNLMTLKK